VSEESLHKFLLKRVGGFHAFLYQQGSISKLNHVSSHVQRQKSWFGYGKVSAKNERGAFTKAFFPSLMPIISVRTVWIDGGKSL